MTKFFGKVGYVENIQVRPFEFEDVVTEHDAYGDVLRPNQRYTQGEGVNDTLALGVNIRIMLDPYVSLHLPHIRYVEYLGGFWKVREIIPEPPGVTLRLGEVWNGITADRPEIS